MADIANLSAADIALREIIKGKMGFEMSEFVPRFARQGRAGTEKTVDRSASRLSRVTGGFIYG
ncbi:MAG: hypothetical protein ACLQU3_15955 [Limisphaerales bacterium]